MRRATTLAMGMHMRRTGWIPKKVPWWWCDQITVSRSISWRCRCHANVGTDVAKVAPLDEVDSIRQFFEVFLVPGQA
jgi:hypothetical protein